LRNLSVALKHAACGVTETYYFMQMKNKTVQTPGHVSAGMASISGCMAVLSAKIKIM
jgi:hypothetical protein